eukprot:g15316.t1
MTGDDSEWEPAPLPVLVKPEPGSNGSEAARVQTERWSSKSERRSFSLNPLENDEEKQLRWALSESMKLEDQLQVVTARSGQKEEANVAEVGTGASAQGESRAERAAKMAQSFANILPKRTKSLANLRPKLKSGQGSGNVATRNGGVQGSGGAVSAEAGSNGGVQFLSEKNDIVICQLCNISFQGKTRVELKRHAKGRSHRKKWRKLGLDGLANTFGYDPYTYYDVA